MEFGQVKFSWMSAQHQDQVVSDFVNVLPVGFPVHSLRSALLAVDPICDYPAGNSSGRKTISDLKQFKAIITKLR
jgi:hypothetical protein